MKRKSVSPRRRAPRTDAARRTQILAAFDRSGLSATDFARQHHLNYTTFCGWRRNRDHSPPLPGFVQVELPRPSVGLVIELGPHARLHLTSASQMELAATLLRQLHGASPC